MIITNIENIKDAVLHDAIYITDMMMQNRAKAGMPFNRWHSVQCDNAVVFEGIISEKDIKMFLANFINEDVDVNRMEIKMFVNYEYTYNCKGKDWTIIYPKPLQWK